MYPYGVAISRKSSVPIAIMLVSATCPPLRSLSRQVQPDFCLTARQNQLRTDSSHLSATFFSTPSVIAMASG